MTPERGGIDAYGQLRESCKRHGRGMISYSPYYAWQGGTNDVRPLYKETLDIFGLR